MAEPCPRHANERIRASIQQLNIVSDSDLVDGFSSLDGRQTRPPKLVAKAPGVHTVLAYGQHIRAAKSFHRHQYFGRCYECRIGAC